MGDPFTQDHWGGELCGGEWVVGFGTVYETVWAWRALLTDQSLARTQMPLLLPATPVFKWLHFGKIVRVSFFFKQIHTFYTFHAFYTFHKGHGSGVQAEWKA
jgi:hypothetical protein